MTKKEEQYYKLGQMGNLLNQFYESLEEYYSLKKEVEPLTDKDIENYRKYENLVGSIGLEFGYLEVRVREEKENI